MSSAVLVPTNGSGVLVPCREVERGWRDLKQVIDLRPVYHRKEDRIRAHMVLCWLALLLVRLIETSCGGIWPQLRREQGRIAVGTFAGPDPRR
ncbi:MAG TPA: hypothetical protein VGJ95_04285 [Pseudonocardiaceae bacterium]|jgi:hypothetical protein